jgi:putative transposase
MFDMQDKYFHGRLLCKGRYSEAGRFYHVTATTLGRRPFFSDFRTARKLIRCLREAQLQDHAATLAFVVMPDHLHWLLQLGHHRLLSQVVGAVKSVSAHRAGQGVWQAGFHDHAIRADDDIKETARYIVTNPVRAGLVERPHDYPHWDCIWL